MYTISPRTHKDMSGIEPEFEVTLIYDYWKFLLSPGLDSNQQSLIPIINVYTFEVTITHDYNYLRKKQIVKIFYFTTRRIIINDDILS